jgi:hypothetical protein
MRRYHDPSEAISGPVDRPSGRLRHPAALVPAAQELQHKVGNRVAASLLALGQAKLIVNPAGDGYEREADSVAAQVVERLRSRGPAQEPRYDDGAATFVPEEPGVAQLGPMLSRRAIGAPASIGPEGGELSAPAEQRIEAARRQGRPLPEGVRRSMEAAFGADFSGIRVNTGREAEALNETVGAVAFTVGGDIFLGRSAPQLSSSSGEKLLAHELTHTLQQGAARSRSEREPDSH